MSNAKAYMATSIALFGMCGLECTKTIDDYYPPKRVKEGPLPDYKVKNHRRKKGK